MTKYPNKIDTDAEIPRVDDNISEVAVEVFNAMKEAIIAIQKAIGENPQGSTATLVSRLSQVLNDDGTFKASALIAAGLIALPITNSQVSPTAAIEEAKLDLDFATQSLQNQIWSNDIDIANLQQSISNLLNNFALHISANQGVDRHDAFDILLDKAFPLTTPPAFASLTATEVGTALLQINNKLLDHIGAGKVAAHNAGNVSVDNDGLRFVTGTNVQTAIEQLDSARSKELDFHRDEMHANGFSRWANSVDGYNINLNKVPATNAYVVPSRRSVIEFDAISLAASHVKPGDVVILTTGTGAGKYIIDDVGPRVSVGLKGSLAADQLEIVETFANGFDGYATAAIYGEQSVFNYQTNVASTIHQSDLRIDSIQCARPKAAKVISLGADTKLLDSTHTLSFDVGTSFGSGFRTVTITDLNKDRLGVVQANPTVDTVVERINFVLQNRVDGLGFPAAAYRVGDEIMISHNWVGSNDYYLMVNGSGSANFILGLDGYGADVTDQIVRPSQITTYHVAGKELFDFKTIAQTTASISGQTFTFSSFNPVASGIKEGHLIHLKTHPDGLFTTTPIGTYFIIGVTSSTVTIQRNTAIPAAADVVVEFVYDAVALNDFSPTAGKDKIIETFVDSSGILSYNERLSFTGGIISNLSVADVSDNALAATYTLKSTVVGPNLELQVGSGKIETVSAAFSGTKRVYLPSNIEFLEVDIVAPVGSGIVSDLTIRTHINEEELLEICSCKISGSTVSRITDKRLFGHLGLDELREDVQQAFVETPLEELRSDGIVRGFDILDSGDVAPEFYISNHGLLIRGGVAYIGGVRVSAETRTLMFKNVAGTYHVLLNPNGNYSISDLSLDKILDGYAGHVTAIAKVVHDGATITSVKDTRFFINNLDNKVELILDLTNRMVGTFATVDAALEHINNYPYNERFKVRLVSTTSDDVVIDGISKDITIVLDGTVKSLTVNVPCRIISESVAWRSTAHIDELLNINSGCTYLEVDGVRMGGVELTATVNSSVKFRSCMFDGGPSSLQFHVDGTGLKDLLIAGSIFSASAGPIVVDPAIITGQFAINGTTFLAGAADRTLITSASDTNISNTTFKRTGIQHIAAGKHLVITNCVFEDLTTSKVIESSGESLISNCIFENIDAPNFNIIECSDLTVTSHVSGCSFKDILSLQPTDIIILIKKGSVSNCSFVGVEFSTTPGGPSLVAPLFHGNTVLNSINDAAYVGAELFLGNVGFNTVGNSAEISKLKIVSDNSFEPSLLLKAIDISAHLATDAVTITGNTFSVAAGDNAILFGGTTSGISIVSNIFNGASLTLGSAIALANSQVGNVIDGNIFRNIPPFSSTGAISGIKIINNDLGSADAVISLGSASEISHNYKGAGKLTIAGAPNTASICYNTFDGLSVFEMKTGLTSIEDSVIMGNFITLFEFSPPSISRVVCSSNIFSMQSSSDVIADKLNFTNNVVTYAPSPNGFDRIEWANSFVTNNIFNNTDTISFKIITGSDANFTISENAFAGDFELVSSGAVSFISVDDNVNTSAVSKSITTNTNINKTAITGNFGFNINVGVGANQCSISGNMMSEEDLTISGSAQSLFISNNALNDCNLDCNSSGGLVVINNFINNNLEVLSQQVGAASIEGAFIVNNVILGTASIMSGGTSSAADLTFKNSELSSNRVGGNIDLIQAADGVGSIAKYTITNCSFLNNTSSTILFLSSSYEHDNTKMTIDDISFLGNRLEAGGVSIVASGPSLFGEILLSNITIERNSCEEINIVGNLQLSNISVSNNISLDKVFIIASGISPTPHYGIRVSFNIFNTVSQTKIAIGANNSVNPLYFDGVIIDNNSMPFDGDNDISLGFSDTDIAHFSNFKISNNITHGLILINTAGGLINGDINGNSVLDVNDVYSESISIRIFDTPNAITNLAITSNSFDKKFQYISNIGSVLTGISFSQNVFSKGYGIYLENSNLNGSISELSVTQNSLSYVDIRADLRVSGVGISNNIFPESPSISISFFPLGIYSANGEIEECSIVNNNMFIQSGLGDTTLLGPFKPHITLRAATNISTTNVSNNLCIDNSGSTTGDIVITVSAPTGAYISKISVLGNRCQDLVIAAAVGGVLETFRESSVSSNYITGNLAIATVAVASTPSNIFGDTFSFYKNSIIGNYVLGTFEIISSRALQSNISSNSVISAASVDLAEATLSSLYSCLFAGNMFISTFDLVAADQVAGLTFNNNYVLGLFSANTGFFAENAISSNSFNANLGNNTLTCTRFDQSSFAANFIDNTGFKIILTDSGESFTNSAVVGNTCKGNFEFEFSNASATSEMSEVVIGSNFVEGLLSISPTLTSAQNLNLDSVNVSNNQSNDLLVGTYYNAMPPAAANHTFIFRSAFIGNVSRTGTSFPRLANWDNVLQSILSGNQFGTTATEDNNNWVLSGTSRILPIANIFGGGSQIAYGAAGLVTYPLLNAFTTDAIVVA